MHGIQRWLYLTMEAEIGALPCTTSEARDWYLAKGASNESFTLFLPKYQPRYLPELCILKSANSGICFFSQLRIAKMIELVNSIPVNTSTHLTGFNCKPDTLEHMRKILACLFSDFSILSADPKSSAHTRVVDSLGPSEIKMNRSTIGLIPNRKRREDNGQPVLTPPRT